MAQRTPPPSPGNGGTDMQDVVVVLIGVIAVVCLFWWGSHAAIARFVMQVRLLEAYLIPFDPTGQAAIRHWVASTSPETATLEQLVQSGAVLGRWLGWGVLAILGALGGWLAWRSPEWPGRYTQTYTMASLARQESSLWRTIRPVLDENLLDVSLDDPVQGMRQTPRAYGRRLKFVVPAAELKELPQDAEPVNAREVFLVGTARRVFVRQLGQPWQGIDRLKPHEKALFAAFAAQACYANEAAQALINELPDIFLKAVKARDAGLITSPRVDALLVAHGQSEVVKAVLRRHTYVRTVLMALLVAARQKGILPPNWFRWLKTVDRITWYALTDLGTENASAEAAGVRAHYNAERLIRGAINEPEIEAAVDGFRDYLQEILDEEPDVD